MIPEAFITARANEVPWPDDSQIEQDLIISRVMVELYEDNLVSEKVAMRGGTALHKLFFEQSFRYSEDIDLVLLAPEKKSEVLNRIEEIGISIFNLAEEDVSRESPDVRDQRIFEYQTTMANRSLELKVELNTGSDTEPFRETVLKNFAVDNPWFSGSTKIRTYELEELLGTKLRALCDRNRGRDLFDLWLALDRESPDLDYLLRAFDYYFKDPRPSLKRFEEILIGKILDHTFLNDVDPLIRTDMDYSEREALKEIYESLGQKLSGSPGNKDELERFFQGEHFVQE